MGPRKLAKVLLAAFQRWTRLQVATALLNVPLPEIPPMSMQTATPMPIPMPASLPTLPGQPEALLSILGLAAQRVGSLPVVSTLLPSLISSPLASPIRPPASLASGTQLFLLVDDNHINLKILCSYMKKLGQAYQTATNGQEAVDAFRRDPQIYGCVFMDISMPVMDGFEATRRIRAYETEKMLRPVSIFALSGLASVGAQEEAFASGVDLFLSKPVRLKELGSILASRNVMAKS